MYSMDILCLANSWKHGGACVAGIRMDTGEWVRPVTDATDGTLPYRQCRLDNGHEVKPLDVVRIPVERHAPKRHQPENWLVGPGNWQLCGTHTMATIAPFLDSIVDPGPVLLGNTWDKVPEDQIPNAGVAASLTLVRVTNPLFSTRPRQSGGHQLRIEFEVAGASYNLSLTDRHLDQSVPTQGSYQSSADWYLTISLSEPFNGACYKLAACALPIDPA